MRSTGNLNESMLSVAVCTSARDYDTQIDAVMARFRIPYFDVLRSQPPSRAAGSVIIYGRDGRVLLTSLPQTAVMDTLGAQEALLRGEGSGGRVGQTHGGTAAASFRQVSFSRRTWLASSLQMDSTGWTVVVLVDKAAITGRIIAYPRAGHRTASPAPRPVGSHEPTGRFAAVRGYVSTRSASTPYHRRGA